MKNYSIFYPKTNNQELLNAFNTVDKVYRKIYLPWTNEAFVYTTTFEKLVGSKGGGSDYFQFLELKNIAKPLI